MSQTVEQLCAAIERYQLTSSRDLAAVRSRWFKPDRKDQADPAKFCQWLRSNRFLSDFALEHLLQGKANELVLNQYRVHDQLKTGPLAGAYVAADPLDRPVVIQVFSSGVMSNPTQAQHVRQLVQQLIALNHPHVCRILDAGEAGGRYYIVREHYDSESLANILQKRGKLPADRAAGIIALACEGLRALHERHLPGGALTPDCVLLTAAGKGPRAARSVRILIGAARKDLFDPSALGRPEAGSGDDLELMDGSGDPTLLPGPEVDVLRLGRTFYRTLTGRDPFPGDQWPRPSRPAAPLREVAPEVPEMLAQVVEQMIDVDPAKRARNAGHLAKALRVFLKAEEESKETRHEEQVVLSPPASPQSAPAAESEEEEEEEPPRRPRRAGPREGAVGKLLDLWDDYKPQQREWVFLAAGALSMIAVILVITIFTGIHFAHIACLATGAAVAFFVERFIRWREKQAPST
jgi:serine/threonine protein kinase